MQSISCEILGWIPAQAGIKIAGRNIDNLGYAGDTTLIAESEGELKTLVKVKEQSEKTGLKLNIQKTKIMASGPVTSWQIDGEKMEAVADFIFWGSKITADGDCSNETKICRALASGRMNLETVMFFLSSHLCSLPEGKRLPSAHVNFSYLLHSF